MTIAVATERALLSLADTNFPNIGTIGYIALLSAALTLNVATTVASSTDVLTTGSAHGLTTGSRVRLAVSGGALPTGISASQDYFAIVISTTTYKLATTAALAVAGTAINLTDDGTGTITTNEQELNSTDLLAVLLAKEVTHPSWTARSPLSAVGASTLVSGNAEKPPKAIVIQNTNAAALEYKHVLYLFGASVTATIGSGTGVLQDYLSTEATTQSIALNETKSLVITIKVLPN
jgi:hypothetical protein